MGTGYPERVRKSLKPYVASLAVDASVRAQGLGAALMRGAEERAQGAAAGAVSLTLEVEDTNAAALALYSKLGYQVTRRDENGRKLVGDVFFGKSERVTKLWLEKELRGEQQRARAGWLD